VFEIAELGHTIKKSVYNEEVPEIRTELLLAQQKIKQAGFSVIVLVSGVDGGGKGDVINILNEWMDPRLMRTIAFGPMSDEERERPKYWRFWRTLPPKGTTGIYVGSWYSDPISERVYGKIDDADLYKELNNIKHLEQELIDDGALIIKCWLHLKKDTQKKRLKDLEKKPETQWKVTEKDKKHLELYDSFIQVAEHVLTATSTGDSPWLIVDGTDFRYSSLTIARHLLNRIDNHILQQTEKKVRQESQLPFCDVTHRLQQSILDTLDLSLKLDKKEYNAQLAKYQARIGKLTRKAYEMKKSSILVFEGWDAGGKGGAIRRVTHAIDARSYRVISVAAPTDEERLHHYLWRFWRHIPMAGQVTIYDRSWYGRVLVERVEGFAQEVEWKRAYSEIVNFEQALCHHGIVLVKFWLHIDQDEQLNRFKEREQISYKQHKITEEDYRNREKWDDYKLAVNEMVTRTSTQIAPWVLIEGNDKKYARIKVLQTYCEMLERSLEENDK
jgi:polyphosphate:AMP phosphotransferase